MQNYGIIAEAIQDLSGNPEQLCAVNERHQHCVVLAGPGSGKTKVLTVAMARALLDDVVEPRGIACITYNNECAIELERRLERLGINANDHVFIGTVHGFALSEVIAPYARCTLPEFPSTFRVAGREEVRASIFAGYREAISKVGDAIGRWEFAKTKRLRDVNRKDADWNGRNPELARFIEAYEADLRRHGLIDFEDMPLLAYKIIRDNPWVANALRAKFPVLFIDEYQDLGAALHELVQTLCFSGGIRLFAVGDVDQSIYAFTGANPELLRSLSTRPDVRTIKLRLNYRCGNKIIRASMAGLGEEREYLAPEGTDDGDVFFHEVSGGLVCEGAYIIEKVLPDLRTVGIALDEIGILYRYAEQGDIIASAALHAGLPIVRADNKALVRRNSRLARLAESCARWVTGGWKDADPRFSRLSYEASNLVLGPAASIDDRRKVELELMTFLRHSIDEQDTTNSWLQKFRDEVIQPWRLRAVTPDVDWNTIDEMIARTGNSDADIPLDHFGGRIQNSGRLNLSTLHSSKGREFDAVILFAMNDDVIPGWRELRDLGKLREARRLFYVGITRARRILHIVSRAGGSSPWVTELQNRIISE